MPIYNNEQHLRQALDSILNQTQKDWELIISDNASTDGTAAICSEYAAMDARIRYIRQPQNIGAPRNWNAVVHAARGKYFKWASGNDYCAPNTLSLCLDVLENQPEAILCFGRTELVDSTGLSLGNYTGDLNIDATRPSNRFKQILKGLALNNAQQGLFRLDVLRQTRLDRLYPGGDIPLMAELALYGTMVLIPTVTLYRRFAPGTVMAMRSPMEVARMYNPEAKKAPAFLRIQYHTDNFISVLRAPISIREKIRTWAIEVKYAAWDREKLWAEVRTLWASLPDTATMVAMNSSLRIGLLGPYASANLGDTSVQMAVMRNLKDRLGPVRFLGISTVPGDVVQTHKISAIDISGRTAQITLESLTELGTKGLASSVPIRKFFGIPSGLRSLLRIYKTTGSLDLLIISGSGQIDDFWGGPWGHPFRMLVWSACARLHGIPVAVLGVGVDELHTRLGAWFSIQALHLSQFRAFRDAGSMEMLLKLGLKAESQVCPDPAFSLRAPRKDPLKGELPAYAVISPIARGAWPGKEDDTFENYLNILAKMAEYLLLSGLDVRFACSQIKMDISVVERIKKKMAPRSAEKCFLEPIATVYDYIDVAAKAELVVASRLHAAILALVAGTPIITFADTRKVKILMEEMQLESYALDLGNSQIESALFVLKNALAKRGELKNHILGMNVKLQTRLASTYCQLIATVFPNRFTGNLLRPRDLTNTHDEKFEPQTLPKKKSQKV
jgi:polysaccharide pyruvyl transferase WcaK-like protein/glycosyltransferase involved in cell wall biosynthesis